MYKKRKGTRISIDVEMPSSEQLPPTREEKWQALREKVEDMMEMADVGHNEAYCLKCLKTVWRKLKTMPPARRYATDLAERIERFYLEHTGKRINEA